MSLPVELVINPDGVEFRSLPNRLGRIGGVRVARTDLRQLADYFTQRFELDTDSDDERRLAAAIEAMTRREEVKAQYVSNHHHVATHCRHAGVAYTMTYFDSQRWQTTSRCIPLFQSIEPNGFLRSFSVDLDLPDDHSDSNASDDEDDDAETYSFDVREEFWNPAAPYPDDELSAYSHAVKIDYDPASAGRAGGATPRPTGRYGACRSGASDRHRAIGSRRAEPRSGTRRQHRTSRGLV
jgi:hypothetical protein